MIWRRDTAAKSLFWCFQELLLTVQSPPPKRIRKEIADLTVPGCPRQITISLGVATWMAGEAAEAFVARADAALYSAKSTGRNRVEVALDVKV